ncbi:MAG: thioesterase II family protein [Blastocatellia bacterium]
MTDLMNGSALGLTAKCHYPAPEPPESYQAMNKTVPTNWLAHTKINPLARARLFCFPYAGGSAAVFNKWSDYLPRSLEVCPVQLPGRSNRLGDVPFTRLAPLVDAALENLLPHLERPFALFGHSMGAIIAFELARRLEREYHKVAIQLFVSACRAPQLPVEDLPMYDLPEAEFIRYLRKLNGTPREILRDSEMMRLMLPLLRADIAVCQTYNYTPGPLLSCRMTAFGGIQDMDVTREHLQAWSEQTTGPFSLRMLPGDHFFLHSAEPTLLLAISQETLNW